MPLPDIQLDDRRFEDLVAEARRRIPVYTPEWTDHNESDPGITLIQLFAWLEEMILWRLNKVPKKNYVKFLQMLGIELTPPVPAQAELTFTLAAKDLPAAVLVPQGTRVTLSDAGDGPPVIFETDDNLHAVGASLTAIQSFDGRTFSLFTETSRVSGASFPPLSLTPQRDAALYLGFDRAFPDGTEIRMIVHAATSGSTAVVQAGAGAAASGDPTPPALAHWEYWSTAGTWQQLATTRDDTLGLTRTGTVIFTAPAGAKASLMGLLKKPDDKPLFWVRYHIDDLLGPGYLSVPMIEDVVINTIGATNAVTVTDELLGASSGLPNQTFRIANMPILPPDPADMSATGIVAVDEGEDFVTWTEVKDFGDSSRNDMHYTLNRSTGVVGFGDGEHGKIPRWLPNGDDRPRADAPNIKVTKYRWGGGARANAGSGKLTALQSPLPFVSGVTNLRPSFGGADEESVDHAEDRAPLLLRTASRAITADDFAFLAEATPGAQIRRAQAFPLHNPRFQLSRAGAGEVPMPGMITVVVVPESTTAQPQPSEDTLRLVANWFDGHRLVTSELFVTGPRYREVSIRARVIAKPSASSGEVELALRSRLLAYFHPLSGGSDGTGWNFGGTIYFSETYRQILTTPGVLRIESGAVTTFVDGVNQPPGTDVDLEPDELVYSLSHEVTVSYE
jgi:Baseplate J-like protein